MSNQPRRHPTTDESDIWRALNAMRKNKRANNRESSAQCLRQAGVPFESKNGGAHLIVATPEQTIDFWPGTGLWLARGTGERRRGVKALLRCCKAAQEVSA